VMDELQSQADFAALLRLLLKEAEMDISQLPELPPDTNEGDATRFEGVAWNWECNRVIFKTSNGYLGLGPNTLRAGDVTVILFGGRVPYILPPQDGYYLFVGEAYIHGVMSGEVVQNLWDGVLKDEEFEIH
jgi:hypothetical protein